MRKLHVIVDRHCIAAKLSTIRTRTMIYDAAKSLWQEQSRLHLVAGPVDLEDRKAYTTDTSDVLRPVSIPAMTRLPTAYTNAHDVIHRRLRTPGPGGSAGNCIFSSDTGRQLIWNMNSLKAGVRIRQMCPHLNQYQRPLGNMILDTLGFGSLIVTFRNCPNSAPLALWAGDPWHPLFQRTTNSDTSMKHFMAMLAKDLF